ncbi:MAG TPA: NYN domain-containing protein [Vicinamibacteria bacterium]|nr:NYN domain-containing protein [Vicinamibacteria bacterium]
MPYLLDGNNLIGRVRRTSKPSGEDRAALVAEIAGRLRQTRAKATIFFDGPAGERASSLGSLSVRVPSSGSADDAIVREVERAAAAGELVVVTADRGLAIRCRDAGAKVCGPDEFFARFGTSASALPAGPSRETPGKVDVAEWMRYFSDEENRK